MGGNTEIASSAKSSALPDAPKSVRRRKFGELLSTKAARDLYDRIALFLIWKKRHFVRLCSPLESDLLARAFLLHRLVPPKKPLSASSRTGRGPLHFVTLCDPGSLSAGRADKLINSLRLHKIEPIILTDYHKRYGNWSKIIAMRRFLETDAAIDPNALIVFTDAHDVFALRHPDEIAENFKSYEVDVLFGAENVF